MKPVWNICKQVPMLPVVILSAIPIALCWTPYPRVSHLIVIAIVAICLTETVIGMVRDIREGHVGLDVLAVIALISTLAVREYWAAWVVVLMVYSGEAIENYAQNKAQSNLSKLMEAAPTIAHIASDDAGHDWVDKSVDEVKIGDLLVVRPGETVPVDGMLIDGEATLDMSQVNGEPVPRTVYSGQKVLSGSINGDAMFRLRATEEARDSQYQRIIEMVMSAQSSRPAVVKTADLLAVPFTVISLIIAGVAWFVAQTPVRFAQVLVLATPCPLLIAAPVAYLAGTGRLARTGILIKSQEVLETLGRVSHVFFDKTGTLTSKQPQVIRLDRPDRSRILDKLDMSDSAITVVAGLIENYSVHILAPGIVAAGEKEFRKHPDIRRDVEDVHEASGKGIEGIVSGHRVRVGRFPYVMEVVDDDVLVGKVRPTDPGELFEPLPDDCMGTFIAIDGQIAARIVLRDLPRPNSAKALNELRSIGVKRLTMLTGDKPVAAKTVAKQVGIDDVRYELLPQEKADAVKQARDEMPNKQPWWDRLMMKYVGESMTRTVTMMVGDGVNDAPVLASADIGMAMTGGTSTAASQSAQVVIMNDNIEMVPRAIIIARQTKRVMLQAVCIGLGLAIIGMICAACNLIPAVIGAILQEAIDVISIVWALTALADRKK
ncbi:ATPase [Pseudoscardovia radai]|uniref:ATPase n=1 Tax=Pseudoscardovia radai TaxID=987066 RepID=A0A261EWH6_9BIFI|nr:heavy metal translocating P-type ATPase [Pseudoscardovia radai]OZG51220.1 ATPase [Pseudoscardovia radai]